MNARKIVVTGPVCAGKTTFVHSLTETSPVSTEKAVSNSIDKSKTTVALDFGRTTLGDHSVKLFGTPGQKRFDYMWEVLTSGADGVILLVPIDQRESLLKSLKIVRHLDSGSLPPVAVGMTRSDLADQPVPDKMKRILESISICIDRVDARDPNQCRSLLASLLNHL